MLPQLALKICPQIDPITFLENEAKSKTESTKSKKKIIKKKETILIKHEKDSCNIIQDGVKDNNVLANILTKYFCGEMGHSTNPPFKIELDVN